MLTIEDWGKLVDALQKKTGTFALPWIELNSGKSTARKFQVDIDSETKITLFGQMRGFSYKLSLEKKISDQPIINDSVQAKTSAASHGIEFNKLFKTVIDAIERDLHKKKRQHAAEHVEWIMSHLEAQESGRLVPSEPECPEGIGPLTENEVLCIVNKLTSLTQAGLVKWETWLENSFSLSISEEHELGFTLEIVEDDNSRIVLFMDSIGDDVEYSRQTTEIRRSLERLLHSLPVIQLKRDVELIQKDAALEDVMNLLQ